MASPITFLAIDKEISEISSFISSRATFFILSASSWAWEIIPEASEKISYGIPTFYLNGNLVHFAAYKNHIGFYPGASGIEEFLKEISKYKNSKGAVQFPLKEDLPIDLIKKIVAFRVNENISKNDN